MDELLNKIITYAKEHTQFSAPALQVELHLGYRELTVALKTLQEKDVIKFIGGMCYEYNTTEPKNVTSESGSEDEKDFETQYREYLEMRRQEILRRMQSEPDNDDEEDDEDDEEDNDEEEDYIDIEDDEEDDESDDDGDDIIVVDEVPFRIMPNSTTLQILHYCIQLQCVSLPLIQRRFRVGYVQAVKMIDWMVSMGYVTSSNGATPGKVLLTEEKFIELYGHSEENNGVKCTAEFQKAVGNLCDVLSKVAEEKENETIIGKELFEELKSSVEGNLFEISKSVGFVSICAKGLTFSNGTKAEFYVRHCGKIIRLCDNGITYDLLCRKPRYRYTRALNAMKRLAEKPMIHMDDRKQLLVDVYNLSQLPEMYYYLYWEIESLVT